MEGVQYFNKKQVPVKTLSNGIEKPVLGFGTWLLNENDTYTALKLAIRDFGYRQIDTARIYNNEAGVGRAIKECI